MEYTHSVIESTDHFKLIDWVDKKKDRLSSTIYSNPNALDYIANHTEEIDWFFLSQNTNPKAIHIIEQHPDKINLEWLSGNPSAIHLLEKNVDELYWFDVLGQGRLRTLDSVAQFVDWKKRKIHSYAAGLRNR